MSRHFKSFLFATAAMTMMTGAALADPITYAGTFSIIDTSQLTNVLTISSSPVAFSESLSLGVEVQNITLSTFTTTDTTKTFSSYASDTIEGIFTFTSPAAETATVNGSVSEATYELHGHFASTGTLIWDTDDLLVNFSDGSQLSIILGSDCFSNSNGTADAEVVSADFKMTKEPVPEPASLALLGGGLFGLGMISKRRRALISTAL